MTVYQNKIRADFAAAMSAMYKTEVPAYPPALPTQPITSRPS